MKILVIGLDSFIAQKFLKYNESFFTVMGVSMKNTRTPNEIVLSSFDSLDKDLFSDMDVVINFAGIVHRPDLKDFEIYDEVNHKLAVKNALIAKKAGVKLFVQMSTIAVYGNSEIIDITTPCKPTTPYGISKLNADIELIGLQDENFKIAIVRPPMVYGGSKSPGNLSRLIKLINKGLPLPFDCINNQRHFIHVNNLVQYLGIIAKNGLNGVFLVCDKIPVSTTKLLQTIAQNTKKNVIFFKLPKYLLLLFKVLFPSEYIKLFKSSVIHSNFPAIYPIEEFGIVDEKFE